MKKSLHYQKKNELMNKTFLSYFTSSRDNRRLGRLGIGTISQYLDLWRYLLKRVLLKTNGFLYSGPFLIVFFWYQHITLSVPPAFSVVINKEDHPSLATFAVPWINTKLQSPSSAILQHRCCVAQLIHMSLCSNYNGKPGYQICLQN